VVKEEEVVDDVNGESDGLDVFEGEESDEEEDDEVVDVEVDTEDIAGKAPGRRQNGKVEGGLTNGGENGARCKSHGHANHKDELREASKYPFCTL
jgi:tRNA wybutosine-synthesizing protein 1